MATSTPAADAPRSKKPLIVAALVVVLLAAAGGAGYFFLAKPAPAAAPAAPVAVAPIFVPLDPWTVNLQGDGHARFLHVGLTLKAADKATQDRIAEYLPEVRSRILTLLANRDPATLATADDKSRLGKEIAAAVNRSFAQGLPEQRVTDVMFTAFVVQ
jgi:flagellar FliL protein